MLRMQCCRSAAAQLPGSLRLIRTTNATIPPCYMQTVFAVVSLGAVVLTVNVVLLGGTIGFFQSICLLGYCLFPMDVAAIVCVAVDMMLVRWIVVPVAVVWSSWASIPFIAGAVPVARKALAVYPLVMLYVCVGWIALLT